MMVMMSANSFVTVYLGLELLLCLYAMVALNRDSAASTEAAMNTVLGALASGLLLYGSHDLRRGTLTMPRWRTRCRGSRAALPSACS